MAESAARSAETHTQALARKTRQTNIAALDSAYATLRDQSWSTSLATTTSTRTDPWTVQARQQAAAKATRTASVSTATSTHDAALASYLADWTNSNIDAKTLAINARATAIATSSGAKNLANYNFGTNVPVIIGGITEEGKQPAVVLSRPVALRTDCRPTGRTIIRTTMKGTSHVAR